MAMKNTRMRIQLITVTLAALAAWTFGSGLALAQDDKAVIAYRQMVMRVIGANMGSMGEILKNKLPHGENIPAHAASMNAVAKIALSAFKQQVTAGDTDAKPEIWQNWSKYEAAMEKLIEESAAMAALDGKDMRAIGGQMKKLGGACKGCHEDFRKPKEESYKRK